MLLVSLSASAQYDFGSGSRILTLDATASVASDVNGYEDMPEQLELAFSAGTTPSTTQLALHPETGTLFLQTLDDHKQPKTVPLQIVSRMPAIDDPGLMELMDGLVVANGGSHAFLVAPVAWDPVALAHGLAEWGALVQTNDGRVEITNSTFEPALHFSATFTFRGIRQTGSTGAMLLKPPLVRNSISNEHFYTLLYADGTEEILQPIVAAPHFMTALAALHVNAQFNRNLGVVSIDNRSYRPSYFVESLQPDTAAYLDANSDEAGIAFRPGDVNEDGLMDYEVISALGSQWLFAQP
jgi:hypothetical protein